VNAPVPRRCCPILVAALVGLAACQSTPPPPAPAGPAESTALAAFVDEFLDQFAKYHPSIAAGNGLHQADGTLEDFSATAIAAEIAMWRGMKARLAAIAPDGLTPDERVDHRIVAGLLDAWILELDTNRTWQKNLMLYASAISDGVHNLMTMESAPAEVRAGRVVSKLKGVPAVLDAARSNLANPPRVMAARGVGMMKGASAMMAGDLSLAFADLRDEQLKTDLAAAGVAAARSTSDWRRCTPRRRSKPPP
jgi:uncharacterized protein (DUF885 family)